MTTKVVFLTSGTTWTVPSDFTSTNTIEAVGAGGAGRSANTSAGGGAGGAGGAYSPYTNISLTPGSTVNIQIGQGGTAQGASGTASFMQNNSAVTFVSADFGAGAPVGSTGPSGGLAANCTTNGTARSGGSGGTALTGGQPVNGGGGGAGGPHGAGAAGGSTASGTNISGSSGGGADGGSAGSGGLGSTGATGGNNRSSSGGGSGGTSGNPGNNGTNGGGGGGGGATSLFGGNGSAEAVWTATAGGTAGPGSGGGGDGNLTSLGTNVPGTGGLYGGGGAGGGADASGHWGVGANGIIVVTYTAASTSFSLSVDAGVYAETGKAVTLSLVTSVPNLLAFSGTYNLTGAPASSDFNVQPLNGAYSITGIAQELLTSNFAIFPSAGAYGISGGNAALTYFQQPQQPNIARPLPLGFKVSTRQFSLLEMVAREWGPEFRAPDHRTYQFTGRDFDSTDLGYTGIYGPPGTQSLEDKYTGIGDEDD